MDILIGGAWPYTNGSLHIGHLAGLLPGDVLARYHRAVGNRVFYVSGSDCHGTPVSVRAKQENRQPGEISSQYHEEFSQVFCQFGFSYDLYGATTSSEHIHFVQEFHKRMYESSYIYEKNLPQAYCESCGTFLSDRYVHGLCPQCGTRASAGQCDNCDTLLEPEMLLSPACSFCGRTPVFRDSKHLFISLTKMEKILNNWAEAHPFWRKNAIAFTKRYLSEGLRDRAVTRDLDWGIDVPREGYEGKKIYIWAENVLGYLSMSFLASQVYGGSEAFHSLWGDGARHYYVHGKDNIPFHTIILPALLIAHGGGWHLPDVIISSEYLKLEGRKISTSQNWAIWAKDMIQRFDPDSVRFYLLLNGPEKRDTDFSWREFVKCHNLDLLGDYGNFVNRTLVFVEKYLGNEVPEGTLEEINLAERLDRIFDYVGHNLYEGFIKDALTGIIDFIHYCNRYFDRKQPWLTRNSAPDDCRNTLYNCIQMVANLAVLLAPFLPFSSEKVIGWLNVTTKWQPQIVAPHYKLPLFGRLFEPLDESVADDEIRRIGQAPIYG
jgi:methionyl-tRNA synthetase